MSRLSSGDAVEKVGAEAVGDRTEDFAAVPAGVHVGAQPPSAVRHRDQAHDGFSGLGLIGVRRDERRRALAQVAIRGR